MPFILVHLGLFVISGRKKTQKKGKQFLCKKVNKDCGEKTSQGSKLHISLGSLKRKLNILVERCKESLKQKGN